MQIFSKQSDASIYSVFLDKINRNNYYTLDNFIEGSKIMLTGKQRANLRKLANNLDTIIQIGKGNIEQPLIKQVDDALAARELIKVKVLTETSALSPREAADILSEATNSEVIQVIGGRIVLYRRNPEKGKYDEYIN